MGQWRAWGVDRFDFKIRTAGGFIVGAATWAGSLVQGMLKLGVAAV